MSRTTSALKSLPLEHVIGGPLNAAVKAQAFAAKTTVDFIQEVGFKKAKENDDDPMGAAVVEGKDSDSGEVRNVTFSYQVQDSEGELQEAKLIVPILTIVPIPFIRIDDMTIDFSFKVTEQSSTDSERKSGSSRSQTAKVKASGGFFWAKASASYSGTFASSNSSVKKRSSNFESTATLDVHVHAVQDEIPAGLGRILNILEDTIKESRGALPASTTPQIPVTPTVA